MLDRAVEVVLLIPELAKVIVKVGLEEDDMAAEATDASDAEEADA